VGSLKAILCVVFVAARARAVSTHIATGGGATVQYIGAVARAFAEGCGVACRAPGRAHPLARRARAHLVIRRGLEPDEHNLLETGRELQHLLA
jgi:hypothetical protein